MDIMDLGECPEFGSPSKTIIMGRSATVFSYFSIRLVISTSWIDRIKHFKFET